MFQAFLSPCCSPVIMQHSPIHEDGYHTILFTPVSYFIYWLYSLLLWINKVFPILYVYFCIFDLFSTLWLFICIYWPCYLPFKCPYNLTVLIFNLIHVYSQICMSYNFDHIISHHHVTNMVYKAVRQMVTLLNRRYRDGL